MATTLAFTSLVLAGLVFLIRFLIAMHQEPRHPTNTAELRVLDWSAGEIRIERPSPGVLHTLQQHQRYKRMKDSGSRRRPTSPLNIRLLMWVAAVLLGCVTASVAQETVYNVPNGDVLDRGKVYFEFDATYMPRTAARTYTPRIVVGVGHRVEIGLNLNGLSAPGDPQATPTPTIKWKAYDGGTNGWAFLIGDDLFIPVQNRTYRAGNYAYAESTKTWRAKTRATFGAYAFTKNVVASGNRAGGQFAIEQPITSRLTLAADWYTGDQALGYVTPGIIFKATSQLTLYGTYQIGNRRAAAGNHQMLVELGWNFNKRTAPQATCGRIKPLIY
jgi:hypothetical protein